MLSHNDLRTLLDDLDERLVLTAYLADDEHDPAQRSAWRLRLDGLLDQARTGAGPAGEHEFDRAREHLLGELRRVRGFLPGPGWVAFVTADGVAWSGALPASTSDHVAWLSGPVIAPILRSLKQARPVILALVDARRARVFRYEERAVVEIHDARADSYIDDLSDRTTSKRAATHSGIRGETARDAAKRLLRGASERMLDDVALRINELAAEENVVVYGGSKEARAGLHQRIAGRLGERALEDASLYVVMTRAEIEQALERIASRLTVRLQTVFVEQMLDRAGVGARVAVGSDATRHAAEGQIDRLLVTPRYARERSAEIETLIAAALRYGGVVEEVGGEAGALLDRNAEGVAARLRYAPQPAAAG